MRESGGSSRPRADWLATLAAIACVILALPVVAQDKVSTPSPTGPLNGKAQIVGVVVDSMNGGYLGAADVLIDGAGTLLRTDSLGKFEIDSLPPGNYQIGVFHPLLDTLGISLATKRFHLGPDSSTFVLLAIPSAATIIHGLCPAVGEMQNGSAVTGHVNDPETLRPVAKAEVSIAWEEISVSKETGIRQTSRLLRDTTDGSGAYKFCGLPSSLQATLQARRGPAVTAEIPVSLGDKPIELLVRTVLLSSAESTAKVGSATVSGIVMLEGQPAGGITRVALVGTDVVAMTNEKGEFTMRNLPSGSRILLARHLGFGAEIVPVDLSSHQEQHVTIRLPKYVSVMDPVLVTARRMKALDKVGFNERMRTGFGYYLGPDRLAKMRAQRVSDILKRVPGLRVTSVLGGEVVSSSRGFDQGCVQYYLDDMPYQEATPGDVDQFVNGSEVVAVEVYQSVETPGRYIRGNGCVTVLLWTRFKIRD
ncbi:MAG: TonB-dependent receptor plug domain-containing protein [Gemmatimonadaceae bacterium]